MHLGDRSSESGSGTAGSLVGDSFRNPLKLLHVSASYIPAWRYGGPIRSIHGLCKGLAELGHDVHVFTTNVDGPENSPVPLGEEVDVEGVKVWYFPSTHLRRMYRSPRMGRSLRERACEFDVIHTHGLFLWTTLAGARAASRQGVPYFVSPRGVLVPELVRGKSRWVKSAWIHLVGRRVVERASGIHMTSSFEARQASHFRLRIRKQFVIPNGIDESDVPVEQVAPPPSVAEVCARRQLVLFLGRLSWEKGLDRALEAMVHVPDAHLAIAGQGSEEYVDSLKQLSRRLGLAGRVTFVGPVHNEAKTALLQNASLLILPSYSENFGNVVLEALVSGCPVAVTPEVGAADVVRESGGGAVVPSDPEAMGVQLAEMLRNPGRLREMGAAAREATREKYTWRAIAAEMERGYRQVLTDQSRR